MRGSSFKSLVLAAALCSWITGAQAQISFGANGIVTMDFSTTPTADQFATAILVGDGNTYNTVAQVDAAVTGITAASITGALATSMTLPPSTFAGGFRHNLNAAGLWLQSRPTTGTAPTTAAITLLARIRNDSPSAKNSVDISYTFAVQSPAAGEIPGHDVYYSFLGDGTDWVKIPTLSDTDVPGTLMATLSFASPWAVGATLYILWIDDNAIGVTDPSYTIDNFSVIPSGAPPTISGQPAPMVTVNERGTVTLSVIASGSAITYQWFKGATALANGASCVDGHDKNITGATSSTLRIAGVQPSDAGLYHCEVSGPNPPSPAVSMNANVMVTPDTTAPKVLYAICGSNPSEFVLFLSEQLDDSCGPIGGGGAVTDISNWSVDDVGGQSLGVVNFTNMMALQNGQSVLGLVTDPMRPHDPTKAVRITWLTDFTDAAATPNTLPAGSVLALCFTNELVALNANWQYNDEDVDPGPTWKDVGFTDTGGPWVTGAGVFDCKRDGGILHPNGLDDCRAMTLYGLGAVGTCLNLQSPVTLTNLITSYFRTHFSFAGIPSSSVLTLNGKFDDGAAVYLNGTEVWRIGIPVGATHTTFSTGRTVGDTDPQDSLLLAAPPSLVSGDNVLAVELHQANLTSTDLTMGLRVSSLSSTPPIIVRITSDGAGHVTVSWGGGTSAGTLRSATTITTPRPWAVVSGAVSPYTTTSSGPRRFFEVSDP